MVSFSSLASSISTGASIAIVLKVIDEYSNELKKAGASLTSFQGIATSVGIALAGAMAAYGVAAAKAAMDAEPIQRSFKTLSNNSDELLSSLQKTTHGMVDNVELMRVANEDMIRGLDQNKLPEMFKNAMVVGEALGRNAKDSIEGFSQAMVLANERQVAQYGIVLDTKKVYEQYASSIGKAANELSMNEQLEARRAEAMKQLSAEAEKLGGRLGDDVNDKWQQIDATFANLQVEIGDAMLPALGQLADIVNQNQGAIQALGDALTYVGKAMSLTIGFIDEQANKVGEGIAFWKEFANEQQSGVGIIQSYNDAMQVAKDKYDMVTQATAQNTATTTQNAVNKVAAKQVILDAAQAVDTSSAKLNSETSSVNTNTAAWNANGTARSRATGTSGGGGPSGSVDLSQMAKGSTEYYQSDYTSKSGNKGAFVITTPGGNGTSFGSKKVHDALITKDGDVIEFDPGDNIMASKNGAGGSVHNYNITVQGNLTTFDQMVDAVDGAIMQKVRNKVSIGYN